MRWDLARLALLFLVLVSVSFGSVSASTGEPLFARSCVLASARALPLDDALSANGWKCTPHPRDAVAPHLWMQMDLAGSASRGGPAALEGDAMPMAGLVVVIAGPEGARRESVYGAAAIARNWTAGTRFSIPLLAPGESASKLFVRIDKPFDRQPATTLRLAAEPAASEAALRQIILFAVFAGMLLVVALSALSLFVALRARFALAHAGMVALFLLFTVCSSSLIFVIAPSTTLWTRTSLAYIGLSCSMALLAPFILGFVEREALTPTVRRAALTSACLLAVVGLTIPLLGPSLPFVMRTVFHLAFVPGMVIFAVLCVTAWRRGSRAIRLVALAWSMPLLAALERIGRTLGLYSLPDTADFAFFFAMAFNAMVMTFATAWRVRQIRKERDRAVAQERSLVQAASTDALTGLANRRAFDARHWREGDFLAVIDVDRFKGINDRCGHAVGDAVLRTIGKVLAAQNGMSGVVGSWRMGGEEFAVLISAPSIDIAALAVNALRTTLSAGIAIDVTALDRPVTVSAGIARISQDGVAGAYNAADRSLYHAKASGRDRLSWEVADRATATIFPRNSAMRAA